MTAAETNETLTVNSYKTVLESDGSETTESLDYEFSSDASWVNTVADKAIDIIIPNGVSIVNQAILSELPTSLPVKGHCAYSVFELQIPVTTPTPTAETKSK